MLHAVSGRASLLIFALVLHTTLFAATTTDYSYTAGKDKDLPSWYGFKFLGFNEARKTNKPILLYVYDDSNKVNTAAKTLETIFFKNPAEKNCFVVDPALKTALNGVTTVWVPKSTTAWPELYTANATKTYSIFILMSNGTPMAAFEKGKCPNKNNFIQTLQMAVTSNPAILEQMKKNPPPDWTPPPPPGEVAAATKEPEEKVKKEDKVSALLERDAKANEKGMAGDKAGAGKPDEAAKKKPSKPLEEKLKDEEERRPLPSDWDQKDKKLYII